MIRNFAALFIILAYIVPAHAASEGQARAYIDTVGSKVLGILNTNGMPEDEKQQKLRQMFSENVDMDWMGRFVLGRFWQQATPEQRQKYMEAYKKYLLARYTKNFSEYSGSKYKINDVRNDGEGHFIVAMDISTPVEQQQDIQAGYRLREGAGGQFRIADIIIEGVSLITTQRSEFASILQQRNMDALIGELENKAKSP